MKKIIQPRSIEERALFFKRNSGKINLKQTETEPTQIEKIYFIESALQNENIVELEENYSQDLDEVNMNETDYTENPDEQNSEEPKF